MKVDASSSEPAPTLGLMHAVHLLTGVATMLLGPILPLLIARWHLLDSQAGLLLMAQFIGATTGGITVSARLARDQFVGMLAAGLGFLGFALAFAFAPTFLLAIPALAVGGFGVGRIIATVNIIGGARFSANRGVALARLNFSWSLGALLSPLLAAWLVAVPLPVRLAVFATLFLACAAALLLQLGNAPSDLPAYSSAVAEPPLAARLFVYFAALLFLYGGLETCLSGWLTTYALRYGQTSLVLSEYTMVLLLGGLTAGRALASWLHTRLREATLQRLGLILSAAIAAALAASRQPAWIAAEAVLLGVALAPVFPATFAIFMGNRPPARTAGIVLAASGIGAASLPWLMGVVSTRTGSLQTALILPVAAALILLVVSFLQPRKSLVAAGV